MKKLSVFLAFVMILSIFTLPAGAESAYSQSPMLDAAVGAGELPPVAERLPEAPKLIKEVVDEYLDYEVGNYGGTLRLVSASVAWSADAFIGMNEALLSMSSTDSDEILPNIVESYTVNEDNTEFVFTLRKGLKWSDGTPVTMADYEFAVNDVVFNEEITPVISSWMRDGGSSAGNPFTFTVIDDYTFSIKFNSSYGGFLVHLSANGWKGYTELLKPAHYLKPFHKAYAVECHGSEDAYYEYIAPFAAVLGYDDPKAEGVWMYVFNAIDMTNWETTDPADYLVTDTFAGLIDKNMPVLYPYIMTSYVSGVISYERNPYYFKVDAEGQQLPYIDYMTTTEVEDVQMVQMKIISGEVDFNREGATLHNMTLYRENAETANIEVYMTYDHGNPMPINVNATYGLNPDGTVKEDEASQAWQEVINDVRFREALTISIDANEISDAIYSGFTKANEYYNCNHDIDGAKALLDEMGVVDIDGDGLRETPSGKKLQWQIWNDNGDSRWVPTCELLVEFWTEIGLDVSVYTTDSALQSTSVSANEVPMYICYNDAPTTWFLNGTWGLGSWAPLWNNWVNAGGLAGAELDPTQYLAPPAEVQKFLTDVESLLTVDAETAVNEVYPSVRAQMAEMKWLITPFYSMDVCVVINSDIGNVPTSGNAIGWGFLFEQFYYKTPQE